MTLTNFLAFLTFILYPCMPPRLLPAEYGFLDTVRHDNAQSVWMSGNANMLAAMPSMHFGYSFVIGCSLIYHSTVFRGKRSLDLGEVKKPLFWASLYTIFGIVYPTTILTTIIATGNHYWLDALVAASFVLISFAANRVLCVFVPLEDWLLWVLRADKPIPTTWKRIWDRS
jgi:PAP2 superfamily